jgi:hypothetical protein
LSAEYDRIGDTVITTSQMHAYPMQGVIGFNVMPLGVGEMQQKGNMLYPNPATNELHVIGVTGAFSYTVKDLTGRTLRKGESRDGRIALQGLSSGNYFLTVQQQDKEPQNIHFIKQ